MLREITAKIIHTTHKHHNIPAQHLRPIKKKIQKYSNVDKA